MSNLDSLAKLVGPLTPVAASPSFGTAFAQYESDFASYSASHWSAEGADWEDANYYDRAFINYAWYLRTGDKTYLDRANALAHDYLENYVEANDYNVGSWWSMPKGLTAHYLLNGDQASLTAIGKMADQVVSPWNTESNWANLFDPHQSEGREQARALETLTQAILVNAPSVGVPNIQPSGEDWGVPGGNDFRALAKSLVEKILTSGFQLPDGSRPHYVDGAGLDGKPIDKPFMNGLMNEALINYYEQVEADPRIIQFIKANLNYMWVYEWDSHAKAFQYIDNESIDGVGDVPSPDLNMLIVNGFGFVYKHTGDDTYLYRGDLVFAGGVEGNWLEGSKQFNQQYASSYNYLAYTRGTEAPPSNPVDNESDEAQAHVLVGGSGDDVIRGMLNADTISGRDGNDRLSGAEGGDRLLGEGGDDVLNGGTGADALDGGAGRDMASYATAAGPIKIDHKSGADSGEAFGDTFSSIEKYELTGHNDQFIAASTNAPVVVFGGAGADIISGSSVADYIDGGGGADRMTGGGGNDQYYVENAQDVIIESANTGIDSVYSGISYRLAANVENLLLTGKAFAGIGNDLANTLRGNGLDNMLVGGAGNDRISAAGGNDILRGGLGQDVLTGESGQDTFDFNRIQETGYGGDAPDLITDFRHEEDSIDLSTIDANTWWGGNQAFSYRGESSFTSQAGELIVKHIGSGSTASTLVLVDINGDSNADMQIQFNGDVNLTRSDFIL